MASTDTTAATFAVEIATGNAGMSNADHVADALRAVAADLETAGPVFEVGECVIRDGNGNTVGSYGLGAV